MNRKMIEKAAGEYSGSILGFKDNPSVMNRHKAFTDGADWRISSVWNDASKGPEKDDNPVLVEYEEMGVDGSYYIVCDDLWDYNYMLRREGHNRILRWAYVFDLLPDRKEGEQ